MSDIRKKKVPGLQEHFKSLSALKDELTIIQEKINNAKLTIQQEHQRLKDSPARTQLFSEKDAIKNEIKLLLNERSSLKDLKDKLIQDINSNKTVIQSFKKDLNIKNVVDIDAERKNIEQRMIMERYTPAQEKELQNKLLDLKKKKQSFSDVYEREIKVRDMEITLKNVKKQFFDKNENLTLRRKELEDLNSEIDSMKVVRNNSVITGLQAEIEGLKRQKDEKMEKKREIMAVIRQKEEEYEKYEQEMAAQIEIENKRKEQKMKVRKMSEELTALEEERSKMGGENFDSVIDAVKKMEIGNLSMHLYGRLAGVGLRVPESEEEKGAIIKKLEKKKEESKREMRSRTGELDAKIRDLCVRINEEKKILEGMPTSEVRIIRK